MTVPADRSLAADPHRFPLHERGREGGRLLAPAVVVGVVLAWATLALCRTPGPPDAAESHPQTRPIARLLTLPLELPGMADLRAYAPALGAAALLAASALSRPRRSPVPPGPGLNRVRSSASWFAPLLAFTLAWTLLSAAGNGSWELSRGWFFGLLAGGAWAGLLSRFVSRGGSAMLIAAALVALLATTLTFWHRHALGLLYPLWPVGPVTLTGALGAVWLAFAAGLAAGLWSARAPVLWGRQVIPAVALTAAVALCSLMLVVASGRRGAAASALGGCGFALGVVAWNLFRTRAARAAMLVLAAAAIVAAAAWVRHQARSPKREVSGPMLVRAVYGAEMAASLPDRPLLGVGPDLFVCRMTSALARRRAETPHVLHGRIDLAGHNEWLQAAYELGLPGGAAYTAIPLLAIVAALRRLREDPLPRRRALRAACAAGLTALVIGELASVNLRHPVLSAWYWTLIGLGVGSLPPRERSRASWSSALPRSSVRRLAALGLAAAAVLVVWGDVQRGRAHALGRALLDREPDRAADLLALADGTFGAARWLERQFDLGLARSAVARAAPRETPADSARAVETWRTLLRWCPGYPGAGGLLAESFALAGDLPAARSALDIYLNDVNPYDPLANLLAAQLLDADDSARIDRLRRALRAGAVDPPVERLAARSFAEGPPPDWPARVATAQEDVTARPEPQWRDPLAPETLRVEACRLRAARDGSAAAAVQHLAARAYGALADEHAPRRRAEIAEADAWQRAAEDLFRADPAACARACEFIARAERFAVLGIQHELVARPQPDDEYIGGHVVPTELPDRLRPLWRTSALLRLACGWTRRLDLRLMSALPADQRNPAAAERLRAELARELVDAFAPLPPGSRPPHYNDLVRLARAGAGPPRAPEQP